jgi:2'-5' RNA ligase
MKYRSFIALEAPAPVYRSLAERLKHFQPVRGVNWVPPQNLHMTLLFLGDVDSERIPELQTILKEASGHSAPFQLALKGLELFPARSPRLVWASLASETQDIFTWHKGLLKDVRATGFEPDVKPLKLHITLGRIKSFLPVDVEREIMQSETDKDNYEYDTITLYRSVLKPDGPVYHVLDQHRLK